MPYRTRSSRGGSGSGFPSAGTSRSAVSRYCTITRPPLPPAGATKHFAFSSCSFVFFVIWVANGTTYGILLPSRMGNQGLGAALVTQGHLPEDFSLIARPAFRPPPPTPITRRSYGRWSIAYGGYAISALKTI